MKSNIASILAALSISMLSLTGCATGSRFSQATQVPPNKAMVYIYKKGGFAGSANTYNVYANNQLITKIGNGAYYPYETNPGRLMLGLKLRPGFGMLVQGAIDREREALVLDLTPGSTHYVALEVGFWGPMFDRHLVEIERSRAEREIQNCKRLEKAQ